MHFSNPTVVLKKALASRRLRLRLAAFRQGIAVRIDGDDLHPQFLQARQDLFLIAYDEETERFRLDGLLPL